MPDQPRLIAGAMSGTSADGVDVAIVQITGSGMEMSARLIRHHARAYPAELKARLFALRGAGAVTLAELARLARDISLEYAHAVNVALQAAHLTPGDVTAVAAHGQTLYHDPPDTIQWLDPALLAARTGCAVVSDFRRADCAAGGQGAPLVPFADYVLFRHATRNRVLLNIGGIANLTFIPAGASMEQLIAFDIGPGNCISDSICRDRGPFGMSWDIDGAGASRGQVIQAVVKRALTDPYFLKPPPKSTDGPAMIELFHRAAADTPAEINDLLATAAFITATSIAQAILARSLPAAGAPLEVIATGGGIHNKAIMGWLRSELGARADLQAPDSLPFPPQAKEALAFALLAAATLDNLPSNIPSCTGATRQVIQGSITPRP